MNDRGGLHRRTNLTMCLALAVAVFFGGWTPSPIAECGADIGRTKPPRLAVVLVVDSLSSELFNRMEPVYTGGFKTFIRRGLQYREAHHDHALTQTAPGHLALISGRFPGPAGIPANEFFDRTQRRIVYCVEDADAEILGAARRGASYRNVDASALGDWMKRANPKSLVFSVAAKDRSAILLGGKKPDGAFWFDPESGGFTTSAYYDSGLPEVVRNFNAQKLPDRFFKKTWRRISGNPKLYEIYAGADDGPGENVLGDWEDSPVFPHEIHISEQQTKPNEDWYKQFMSFPWMDAVTLDFAQALIAGVSDAGRISASGASSAGVSDAGRILGQDDVPDLICVSLSAFDLINHAFGPNSHEIIDAVFRLDEKLAGFLAFLDKTVGFQNVQLVLTSDHGMQPTVEYSQRHAVDAARVGPQVKAFRARLMGEFRKKYENADNLFLFRGLGNISFDPNELAARNIPMKEVFDLVRKEAAGETWMAFVFDRTQLASPQFLDTIGERARHSFSADKGADIYFIPKPHHYTAGNSRGTSHGTPYEYDAHVPLLFWGPGIKPGAVDRPVRTVDLAPTLAEILGVPVPAGVDGKPLAELKR